MKAFCSLNQQSAQILFNSILFNKSAKILSADLQGIYNKMTICDVIKQNESKLANIDFKKQPIIVVNFPCIM